MLDTHTELSLTPSERLITDIVRRSHSISRSKLTEMTILSQQSVHRIVKCLINKGFLSLGKTTAVGRGKPSPQVYINPEGSYSFGLSINTDEVNLAVVNLACEVKTSILFSSSPNDVNSVITELKDRFSDCLKEFDLNLQRIAGLGISLPGFRQNSQTCFCPPLMLESWSDRDLVELFTASIDVFSYAENDATCGAIAELFTGIGLTHSNFGYLSFNYGFGAGIVCNGQPICGSHWNAGEMGNLYTHDQMRSRPALGELLDRLSSNGIVVDSVKTLRESFNPQLPGIQEWVNEVAPQLNLAIRSLVATIDPSVVVFGGEAPVKLRKLLANSCDFPLVDRRKRQYPFPKIVVSCIPGDAAALGAALIPFRAMFF